MTRATNFGRKRTYLEAGFGSTGQLEDAVVPSSDTPDANGPGLLVDLLDPDGEPPKKKKKRIRRKRPKTDLVQISSPVEGEKGEAVEAGDGNGSADKANVAVSPTKKALKKKKWKEMEKQKMQRRLLSSEMRRQKRLEERVAGVTCFACREKGHTAKDCPNVKSEGMNDGADISKGNKLVGICYRCGSTRHTLSKCNKAAGESNVLPFASCFVCNGQGHLASACPQNQEKGIYPNGGCCKLCGKKTHLAKDCDLRNKDNVNTSVVMGSGNHLGADEDDFHTFKRREQEVEKEVKSEDTRRKTLQLKTGVQPGILKSFGSTRRLTKKVVHF